MVAARSQNERRGEGVPHPPHDRLTKTSKREEISPFDLSVVLTDYH